MSELSIQVNYVKLICSAIIDPYHTILPWNVDDEVDKVYCCEAVYGFLKLFTYIIFGYVPIYITLYFINYNRATKTSIQIIFEAISFKNKKKYYQGVKRIFTGSIMTIYSPEYDVNIILPAFYNHRLRLYIYWITPQVLKFA